MCLGCNYAVGKFGKEHRIWNPPEDRYLELCRRVLTLGNLDRTHAFFFHGGRDVGLEEIPFVGRERVIL